MILMDSTVSTGAAAMMAVRVLLVRGRARWGWEILCAGWALTAPCAAGP